MESIINKIYIITSDDRKFNKIKYRLDAKKIKIVKCNPIKGNQLPDDKVENITTKSCSYFCSNKTITDWLTHYNLWKNIAKRDEDNVLILEDRGVPVKILVLYLRSIGKRYRKIGIWCILDVLDHAILHF